MRRVFFVSLFLAVCAFALVCVMLRFSPEQRRTADPIDAQTTVTVLQAGLKEEGKETAFGVSWRLGMALG